MAGGGGDVQGTNKRKREVVTVRQEISESRKMKRKPNYNLEKELTLLWEKIRCRDVSKENRSRLVTEALRKMDGKYMEIAGNHVTARVLQTCVKWSSQPEREAIFVALQPHLLTLSRQKYSVFLVKKLIKLATKKQVVWFISSLHGKVASLLRHKKGAAVVECAFQLGTPCQRISLLLELYSTELQLFKGLTEQKSCSLLETISNLGLQKSSVRQYMTTVIQPILEKGSSGVDVDEISSVPEVPTKSKAKKKKTSEPLLIRIMHTREGLKLGLACLKHGSDSDRNKIIKSLKGHIMKLALNNYGNIFLICLLSIVDDTDLVTEIVIQELTKHLKQLVFDKNGRRPLLQLLHPHCSRYLTPADLACLKYSVHSLISEDQASESATVNLESKLDAVEDKEHGGPEDTLFTSDSKKHPFQRRRELLTKNNLVEALIQTCIENVGELLRTNFGRDVLYEVAVGGKDNFLEGVTKQIRLLHNAIASDAAQPKTEDTEHAFENFYASRVIRRMILDSPAFAAALWEKALKGKCKLYAVGYSSKVLTAYLESPDSKVEDLAKSELHPLIASGMLKMPDHKAMEKQ